jgi:hypothetical protein
MRWIGAVAVVPVAVAMLAALARMNRAQVAGLLQQRHHGDPGAKAG